MLGDATRSISSPFANRLSIRHCYKSGKVFDTLNPLSNGRVIIERETALVSFVGAGKKRDIGNCCLITNKPFSRCQRRFHNIQGSVSLRLSLCELLRELVFSIQKSNPKSRRRDKRLMDIAQRTSIAKLPLVAEYFAANSQIPERNKTIARWILA
jgi:hypothetical protein